MGTDGTYLELLSRTAQVDPEYQHPGCILQIQDLLDTCTPHHPCLLLVETPPYPATGNYAIGISPTESSLPTPHHIPGRDLRKDAALEKIKEACYIGKGTH